MKPSYKKLPGSSSGLGGRHSLFAGEDHLLLVTSVGFHEQYRRLYFADIEAFAWRRTLAGAVWGAVFAIPILFTILVAIFDSPSAWGFLFFGLPWVALLTVHLLRGPTCRFTIVTSSRSHAVPAISRIRNARKLLKELRPWIEAAQTTHATATSEASHPQKSVPIVSDEPASGPTTTNPPPSAP